MYSTDEFASLENMCRELATLAKKEMDYLLTEYWLAEAEEWKQLKDSTAKREAVMAIEAAVLPLLPKALAAREPTRLAL
jgi:hypothetical protein